MTQPQMQQDQEREVGIGLTADDPDVRALLAEQAAHAETRKALEIVRRNNAFLHAENARLRAGIVESRR
jgi:hypothetical protein